MPAHSGLSFGFEVFLDKGGMGKGEGAKSIAPRDRAGCRSPRRAEGALCVGCVLSSRTRAFEDFWMGDEITTHGTVAHGVANDS